VYTQEMAVTQKKKDPMKRLIKSVLSEMIEENEDVIRRIFEEAIEDAVMSKALKDCRPSRKVSRDKVFKTLAQLSKGKSNFTKALIKI
jgi:uncharacterized protein YwgA